MTTLHRRRILRVPRLPRFRKPRVSMGELTFVLSLASVFAGAYVIWSTVQFFREEFPDVGLLRTRFPQVLYQGKDTPPTVRLIRTPPPQWVSLPEISPHAVGAIVVSEDWAFFQHKGYDANQIRESLKEDLAKGRFARGASTITQQVVRNVFLDKDKNLWRKVKELYLAVRLEELISKKKILEAYLNIAEWGEGIYGLSQAARFYFGKAPSQLTAKEGAFLAMLLPSPKRYSQSFRSKQLTDYARSTIRSILQKMEQAHYLTEEQRAAQAAMPLSFEAKAEARGEALAPQEMPVEDAAPSEEPVPPPADEPAPQESPMVFDDEPASEPEL